MNPNHPKTITRLESQLARVTMNGRSLVVGRSDEEGREKFCPVELISAALGS